VNGRILIFTPAALLLDREGNGVRPVLSTLDLAFRRGATVVLLWPGETPEAGRWARETMGGAPHIACAPGKWEGEVRRVAREAGARLTVGVGSSPSDLPWLAAVDRAFTVEDASLAWRAVIEEVLAHDPA
jgi:hypothetical protein